MDEIIALNQHIMEKIEDPGRDPTMRRVAIDEGRTRKHKVVLTNLAAGLLIGKGGLTIKKIQTNCRAKISIAPMNEGPVSGERLLTIYGGLEDRKEAMKQVAEVIAQDPSNMANTSLTYPTFPEGNQFPLQNNDAGPPPRRDMRMNERDMRMNEAAPLPPMDRSAAPYNNRNEDGPLDRSSLERALMDSIAEKLSVITGRGAHALPPPMPQHNNQLPLPGGAPPPLKARVEITVEVPQSMVGGLLGKSGSIIKEMVRNSGAKLNFADKTDAADAAGATRNLTISGGVDAAYKAFTMVNERVADVAREHQQHSVRGGGDGGGRFGGRGGDSPPGRRDEGGRRSRWDETSEPRGGGGGGRQSGMGLQGFLSSYWESHFFIFFQQIWPASTKQGFDVNMVI